MLLPAEKGVGAQVSRQRLRQQLLQLQVDRMKSSVLAPAAQKAAAVRVESAEERGETVDHCTQFVKAASEGLRNGTQERSPHPKLEGPV